MCIYVSFHSFEQQVYKHNLKIKEKAKKKEVSMLRRKKWREMTRLYVQMQLWKLLLILNETV